MAEDTCRIAGCDTRAKVRGLCGPHYGSAWRNGDLDEVAAPPKLAPESFHRLSSVDPNARTGVCSVCGPVRVRIRRKPRGAQCWTLRESESKGVPRSRRDRVRAIYGLTDAQIDDLVARAAGRCEICDREVAFDDAAVDHCHESGSVRGILCHRCNVALGWFDDDPARLLAAHLYLRASAG